MNEIEVVEYNKVKYPKHRFNVLPTIPETDPVYIELEQSIMKNGFDKNRRITIKDGAVLDGWTTLRCSISASKKLKKNIKVIFEVFKGSDEQAIEFCISQNLTRRHLSSQERAAMAILHKDLFLNLIKIKDENKPKKDNVVPIDKNKKANESKTNYKLAEQVDSNSAYVGMANDINEVDPDALKRVLDGESIKKVHDEVVKKQEPIKKEETKNLRRNEKAIKTVLDTVWNLSDERSGKEYSKVIQYLHEDIKEKLDVLRTWDIDKLETTCTTCNGMGVIGDKKTKCPDCMGGRIGEYPIGYEEWLEQQVIS
jgi:hypothetical protein